MFNFSIYWECHHPKWLIFFRGVGIPPTIYIYILYIIYIYTYRYNWLIGQLLAGMCPGTSDIKTPRSLPGSRYRDNECLEQTTRCMGCIGSYELNHGTSYIIILYGISYTLW